MLVSPNQVIGTLSTYCESSPQVRKQLLSYWRILSRFLSSLTWGGKCDGNPACLCERWRLGRIGGGLVVDLDRCRPDGTILVSGRLVLVVQGAVMMMQGVIGMVVVEVVMLMLCGPARAC